MKKKRLLQGIMLTFCGMLLFSSSTCGSSNDDDDNNKASSKLSVSPTSLKFDATGATKAVTVNSDYLYVGADVSVDWLDYDYDDLDGVLLITAEPNNTTESRETNIIIMGSNDGNKILDRVTVRVEQEPGNGNSAFFLDTVKGVGIDFGGKVHVTKTDKNGSSSSDRGLTLTYWFENEYHVPLESNVKVAYSGNSATVTYTASVEEDGAKGEKDVTVVLDNIYDKSNVKIRSLDMTIEEINRSITIRKELKASNIPCAYAGDDRYWTFIGTKDNGAIITRFKEEVITASYKQTFNLIDGDFSISVVLMDETPVH